MSEMDFSQQANSLAQQLGDLLKGRQLKLVLAESCTGGMVAETITSVPGSTACFDCGFVTYSNQSKIHLLNVAEQTLASYGAVSEAVAAEMATGCLNRVAQHHKAHYLVGSITGIAGPDGGTAQKPVGMVCFGWAGSHIEVHTQTKIFQGNRQQIRQQATIAILQILIQQLPAT